jgi:hypothetical protein
MSISEDEVQRAVDFLRDTARAAAQARAEYEYLEPWKKAVRCKISRDSGAKTIAEREWDGEASEEYAEALLAWKAAVEAWEHIRGLRVAAEARIAAWQTMSANQRGAWKA